MRIGLMSSPSGAVDHYQAATEPHKQTDGQGEGGSPPPGHNTRACNLNLAPSSSGSLGLGILCGQQTSTRPRPRVQVLLTSFPSDPLFSGLHLQVLTGAGVWAGP